MLTWKLKNKSHKTVFIAAYQKERNYVDRLNREPRHNYFASLETKKGGINTIKEIQMLCWFKKMN